MYAALTRTVMDEAERDRAAAQVERLRERYPRASREQLARRLIRRTAFQCAAASALLTGPAAFFGSLPFGADLTSQTVALHRLVLALAALYGSDRSGRPRTAGVAAGFAAAVSSGALRQGLVRMLREVLPRRRRARAVAGAVAGGALAFGAALAVGSFAHDVFRGKPVLGLGRRLRR